jgi:hypothetical protein
MKFNIVFVATLFLSSACFADSGADQKMRDHTVESHIEDDQYAIVIVQDDGISKKEAKKYALKRASEIALENGYSYLRIESQSEVYVSKSDKEFPSEQSRPRNIYYELIQSGNFGRESSDVGDMAPIETHPGYRVVFTCFKDNPGGKVIKACKYADCSKD